MPGPMVTPPHFSCVEGKSRKQRPQVLIPIYEAEGELSHLEAICANYGLLLTFSFIATNFVLDKLYAYDRSSHEGFSSLCKLQPSKNADSEKYTDSPDLCIEGEFPVSGYVVSFVDDASSPIYWLHMG